MPKHHPDIDLLMDYATGAAPDSLLTLVAAHLHFCKDCQKEVQNLQSLGASLSFDVLKDREKENEKVTGSAVPAAKQTERVANGISPYLYGEEFSPPLPGSVLPDAIARLLKNKLSPWQPLSEEVRFKTIQKETPTLLVEIQPGGRIPQHAHSDLEYVLVLTGAYQDQTGFYQAGDLAINPKDLKHTPTATDDEICHALITYEGHGSPIFD